MLRLPYGECEDSGGSDHVLCVVVAVMMLVDRSWSKNGLRKPEVIGLTLRHWQLPQPGEFWYGKDKPIQMLGYLRGVVQLRLSLSDGEVSLGKGVKHFWRPVLDQESSSKGPFRFRRTSGFFQMEHDNQGGSFAVANWTRDWSGRRGCSSQVELQWEVTGITSSH